MYYLPIYINNRRMHIVKLNRATHDQTLYTFLVNASDNYDVFSLPSEYIQLICDNGENLDLTTAVFTLESSEENESNKYRHSKGIPVYTINISKSDKKNKDNLCNDNSFCFQGHLGGTMTNGDIPFSLKALYKAERKEEYILQFRYVASDEFKRKDTYVGAIRICEYTNEKDFFYASLDFGSEASQIHKSTARDETNMNIRDAFINLVGDDINKDYWQGRKDDKDKTLYKSVYHVNQEPAETRFGDLPMSHGTDTFLKSLLPITEPTKNHILLPNLKLIEQLHGLLSPQTITFRHGSFWGNDEFSVDLSNQELNDFILRQILCNFLAVTLNSELNKQFIHFILLVPNVYYQEKVHHIIIGLYDDFNILRAKDKFSKYKGIEISIVSESDASFFGVRAKASKENLAWKKGAYYLIIDAGKGTTDFSLLAQKGEDLSSYSSIYRSGIPASGHVLTYAFYDALRGYFHGLGIGQFFDTIMKKSVGKETAEVLNFVSYLEQFKIKSGKFEEDPSINKKALDLEKNGNASLSTLNIFLSNVLKDKKLIPGMKKALEDKIKIMTDLLRNSIVTYAKKQNIVCDNIFLTGRAFMLEQFKTAVSDMLVSEGIVNSKNDIFYSDELTKSICTYGAMKVGKQCVVNKNSNMLGCPNLTEEFGMGKEIRGFTNKLKNLMHIIRKKNGVKVDMSFDFFYQGLELSNAKNAIFSLSGVESHVGNGISDDITVYYVGDGYICKHGNTYERIKSDGTIPQFTGEIRTRLVKESIFPFDILSFGLDENAQIFYKEMPVQNTQTIETPDTERLVYIDNDLEH